VEADCSTSQKINLYACWHITVTHFLHECECVYFLIFKFLYFFIEVIYFILCTFCEFLRLPVSSIYDHFSVLEHAECTECNRFCVTYPRRSRYISMRVLIFIRDAIGHSICRGRSWDVNRMGRSRILAFFWTQSVPTKWDAIGQLPVGSFLRT